MCIRDRFKRAVTDSEGTVRAGEDKPGVTNLMSIYSAMTGRPFGDIEREFAGKGYGVFKEAVAQSVIDTFRPIQQEYRRILDDLSLIHISATPCPAPMGAMAT